MQLNDLDSRRETIKKCAREVGAQYSEAPHPDGVCGRLVSADGRVMERSWGHGRYSQRMAYDDFTLQILVWKSSRTRKVTGVNDAPRVQCRKSSHHGFHPANERCALCP